MRRLRDDTGQATLELVMVMPLVFALGWGIWQVSVAGRTAELVGSAARAAARAAAVGADQRRAVVRALPLGEARRVTLSTRDGVVTARLAVPAVGLPLELGVVSASAGFPEQVK